ncbi:MAG: bifunctional (p)ppGpp synthetase/guanosine-3',5'-bis(diphosphate) 3'-pyrophosphohydrolase [Candidatus Eremiobacteraeota bacterium]|nr:bifunctional (p)ppGpp synthetase/guanosine-3',5'-bis(diphosphate) 3'-pyrophosphohydrolase [Candidatus Eremiobacteraeota bacterium]MBV8435210.1 bifunctional (p)ppGpp synthetase/guanosine-3',5'-bis(diphosphate) 3'-pyrophosphohydrolase [Candidatus Eremiobacteraeota bacterium]MBV8583255.1 bifunctional (p)ppGpp synthetase/guanosine-3',5'-bis(diphosphate) 3'-pyrophosphohydrolase [Candidatus Eremiobacteraeota bacterium]
MTIQELVARVLLYDPSFDGKWLTRVYEVADAAHEGQRRASGESYIEHPLAVAAILAELEMDRQTIAAALLHDVVEDTSITSEQVATEFGEEIAQLVEGVTKLTRIPYQSKEDAQVENLRKMFMAMAKDIRVIIIKLADRLHNMRTLSSLPPAKQQAIARETLDIYAPIAHRLGIWKIKWEIEDICLRYLDPEPYREIVERVAKTRHEREADVEEAIARLRREFKELNVNAEIHGRPKHFYSIYSKIKKGRDFSTIYDLTAIRIIVDTVKDCYAALGAVHAMWTPLPGRFKDYIAMPKPNMYQSLHTTVVGPTGEPLEIQIRTWEMHRTGEYGIAAHWRYKEGGKADQFENKLSWLRALLEWQKDMRDSRVFMENLKLDLFDSQVFVFSPRGDVYSMPAGGTPLDFAYSVHTDVGNHCVGAKVNGRIVPLDYQLNNGDICEILVNKSSARPSLDWLSIVKTSSAKHKIKQWFRKERREENVLAGQESLEQELARAGLRVDIARGELIERIASRLNYATPTDLFAAIGFGDQSAQAVANRIRDEVKSDNVVDLTKIGRKPPVRRSARKSSGVRIAGVDDVLVRLSKCCSPVPGDPIIGYVTIGRGVSVHRADCPNVAFMNATPERILQAQWLVDSELTHAVDVEVEAEDRSQLLQDIMGVFAELKTQVSSVTARVRRDGMAVTSLTVQIRDLDHLHKILTKLGSLKNVRRVYRVTKRERVAP